MAVSKSLRFEVLRRDNHTCRYCGSTAQDGPLTVDHVTPVALGGTDEPSNLVTACRDCNYGKGKSNPDAELVADVDAMTEKWATAIKAAAARLAAQSQPAEDYFMEFYDNWPSFRRQKLPLNAEARLKQLYEAGLPVETMKEAAYIAQSAPNIYDRFAYFVGICNRSLAELHAVAKQILAESGEN